jgi:transposase
VDDLVARQALPVHLPREEHVLEPESSCPDPGQLMQVLGEHASEQLAQVAAAFMVIRARSGARWFAHAAALSSGRRFPGLHPLQCADAGRTKKTEQTRRFKDTTGIRSNE